MDSELAKLHLACKDGGSVQRHGFKEKSKLEQVVIEVNLDSSKAGYLDSKHAAGIGVMVVIHLVTLLRKKLGNAALISMGPVKEPMKGAMEEEENRPVFQPPVPSSIPHRLHPINESAGDTAETRNLNEVMEMETQTTTHSNLSLENAESSRKTKTAEWTLLITSLLLEATSASFDQLGYALTSMVMAFLALLLSILDLINKAREKRNFM